MPHAVKGSGGETGPTPFSYILLFGLPRSGTTWVGKVLDSHPDTLYRHEPDSGGALNAIPLFASPENVDCHRATVRAFFAQLPNMRSVRVAGKLPVFRKRRQSELARYLRQAGLLWAKAKSRYGSEAEVPSFVDRVGLGTVHVIWKSIESLGRVGVIAGIAPECKVIHLIRHPCGYVASILRGEREGCFGDCVSASEDYGIFELLVDTEPARRRGLTARAFRDMLPVERLAWRWVLYNEKAMDDLDGFARLKRVCYEELCREPGRSFQELFTFCGLSWESQTEQFIRESCRDADTGFYGLIRDPAKAAYRWREELSPEDVARVMRVAAVSRAGQFYGSLPEPVAKVQYQAPRN